MTRRQQLDWFDGWRLPPGAGSNPRWEAERLATARRWNERLNVAVLLEESYKRGYADGAMAMDRRERGT
jgi:hypothetical protein